MKYVIARLAPMFAIVLLCAVLMFFPGESRGHGQGLIFSKTTEQGLLIDVDYYSMQIEAGAFGRFDFSLYADEARTKPAEFSDLWVRIVQRDGSRAGKTLFAGAVAKQRFGGNGFSFVFPEGGKYLLSVRYNDSSVRGLGEAVAEAEFELDVLRSREEDVFTFASPEFIVGSTSGVLVVLLVLLPFFMRRKSS